MTRVALAFLFAPALAIVLMLTLLNFYYSPEGEFLFFFALVVCVLMYASFIFIGLPIFYFLYKKELLSLYSCISTTFIITFVPFMFLVFPINPRGLEEVFEKSIFASGIALIAGVLFWAIGIRNNQSLNKNGDS